MTPALILAALTAAADPVPAVTPEPACAPTIAVMAEQLAEHYGERPAGGGVETDAGSGAVLFVSAERGTWTMVYFDGPGRACIVGSGTGWQFAPAGEGL